MANVVFDTSSFEEGIRTFVTSVGNKSKQALLDIASEVLRLSQFEVPHDIGILQNSGQIDPVSDVQIDVGYNTTYAAYQHEGMRADGSHVIRHYQGGRKGKYLEDPIRNNIDTFRNYTEGVFDK